MEKNTNKIGAYDMTNGITYIGKIIGYKKLGRIVELDEVIFKETKSLEHTLNNVYSLLEIYKKDHDLKKLGNITESQVALNTSKMIASYILN